MTEIPNYQLDPIFYKKCYLVINTGESDYQKINTYTVYILYENIK